MEHWLLRKADFIKCVCAGEWRADLRQPVFSSKGLPGLREILGWEQAGRGGELRSGNLSAHGAGRHFYLRIGSDALGFVRLAERHDVEPAVLFSKPNWSGHSDTSLPESGE